VDDDYVTIDGIEVDGGSGTADGIHINAGGNIHTVIRNCLVHDVPRDGIQLAEAGSRLDAYDNIIFANAGNGINIVASPLNAASPLTAASRARLWNNTLYNNGARGITATNASNPTVLLQNDISMTNATGGYNVGGLDGSSSNNLSSDATATAASPAGAAVTGQ